MRKKKEVSPLLANISKKRVVVMLPLIILILYGGIEFDISLFISAFSTLSDVVVVYSLINVLVAMLGVPLLTTTVFMGIIFILPKGREYFLRSFVKYITFFLLGCAIPLLITGIISISVLNSKIDQMHYTYCFYKRSMFLSSSIYAKTPELCPKKQD